MQPQTSQSPSATAALFEQAKTAAAEKNFALANRLVGDAMIASPNDPKSIGIFRGGCFLVRQSTAGQPVTKLDLSFLPLPQPQTWRGSTVTATANPRRLVPSIQPVLEDQAKRLGINHEFAATIGRRLGIPVYAQMESGGCAFDYDLDGWPNLYIPVALDDAMMGNPQGGIDEVTDRWGLGLAGNLCAARFKSLLASLSGQPFGRAVMDSVTGTKMSCTLAWANAALTFKMLAWPKLNGPTARLKSWKFRYPVTI